MHYGIPAPSDRQIDHINNQPDDNSIANLRLATQTDNMWNARKRAGTISKFRGVTFDISRNRWHMTARLPDGTVQKRFDTELEAARAYDALIKARGTEFHPLNFPGE